MGPNGTPSVFVTHPSTDSAFYPKTSDDWCGGSYGAGCYSIDLSPWANQAHVKLMFESYNRYGNNLFLNDIQVNGPVGENELAARRPVVSIFPNPSHGKFTLMVANCRGDVYMSATNVQGQILYTGMLAPRSGTISKQLDFSGFARGVYFIRLTGMSETWMEKVVVE